MSSVELHIRETGTINDHPSLVFLHYYGGSSRTWTEVIAGLSADCHCLAVDLRGFGDSPTAPAVSGYSVDESASDVVRAIKERGLECYVLVGHSMGGKIALAVAASTAGTALSPLALLLVAPSPPTPETMTEEDRTTTRDSWGDRAAAQKTVEKITGSSLPVAIVERTVDDMLRTSHAAWTAWEDVGSKEDIADRIAAITIPVHVLVGDRDPIVPAEVQRREVLTRLPQAQLRIIPGAGHLLPLEATEEIVREIRQLTA